MSLQKDISLRLEVAVPGQRIIEMMRLHSEEMQYMVEKATQEVLDEIISDSSWYEWIKNRAKEEMERTFNEALISYEVRKMICTAIQDSVQKAIMERSDELSQVILKGLRS